MKVECPQWSPVNTRRAGRCALGKYGGRPSFGVCCHCLRLDGIESAVCDLLPDSDFHALWGEIHDPSRHWTQEWVRTVRERLPCGDCRRHFAAYVEAHPIPYGDDAACWLWGVDLHNATNKRLGKPLMTPEDARARWAATGE